MCGPPAAVVPEAGCFSNSVNAERDYTYIMETSGGILSRLGEKMLGWIGLALLILIGVAIWQIGPVGRQTIWQGAWRTVFWIAIAAALPWSAKFFIRRILDSGTNWAGVGLLAAFLAVDLGAGLLMLSGCDSSIQATRLAVIEEEGGDESRQESALPTAPPSADTTGVVREALATVAEGAADIAERTAERLRGEETAEEVAAAAEAQAAEDEKSSGHGGWFWFACVAALALAGTYNFLVTEYLSDMAGG